MKTLRLRCPPLWLWLVCLAFLVVRIGGAHVHFCNEGTVPTFAVVGVDLTAHPDDESADHADIASHAHDQGVTKASQKSVNLPVLIFSLLLLNGVLNPRRLRIPIDNPLFPDRLRSRFLTPPRAPPHR